MQQLKRMIRNVSEHSQKISSVAKVQKQLINLLMCRRTFNRAVTVDSRGPLDSFTVYESIFFQFISIWFSISKIEKMLGRSSSRFLTIISSQCVPSRGKRIWVRKPLGSPIAPSKMFRLPVHPVIPDDEKAEIKRLTDNYRCQMNSLR